MRMAQSYHIKVNTSFKGASNLGPRLLISQWILLKQTLAIACIGMALCGEVVLIRNGFRHLIVFDL